jgi:hypothetical protein
MRPHHPNSPFPYFTQQVVSGDLLGHGRRAPPRPPGREDRNGISDNSPPSFPTTAACLMWERRQPRFVDDSTKNETTLRVVPRDPATPSTRQCAPRGQFLSRFGMTAQRWGGRSAAWVGTGQKVRFDDGRQPMMPSQGFAQLSHPSAGSGQAPERTYREHPRCQVMGFCVAIGDGVAGACAEVSWHHPDYAFP